MRVTSDAAQPARPVATIDGAVFDAASPKENSIEVAKGSLLDLSCSTEGATIYYTTDDTCPCIEDGSRVEYTAPVPVTQNTRFRIAAYKEGMAFEAYSERLNLNVTVADSQEPSPDPGPVDPGQKPGSDLSNPDGGTAQPGGSGATSGDTSEGGDSAADPGASGASGAEQEDDANAEATGVACAATGDSSGWAVAALVAGAVLAAGAATCVFLKRRRERQS